MLFLPEVLMPIEMLLQILTDNYLNLSYCVTIVSEEHIFIKIPNTFMSIFANDNETLTNLMLNASEMGCSDYIVQVNNPEMFMLAFEDVVHLGNVRKGDRKIIILPTLQHLIDKSSQTLTNILSMKETSFVANILIIVPSETISECHTYDFITHQFIGKHENEKPIILDRWNSCTRKFEKNANLFPHNISNLDGKIVKVTGFTYTPYVLLDLDPNIAPNGRDGLEVRIVEELCRFLQYFFLILFNRKEILY